MDALDMLELLRERLCARHVAYLREHECRAGFGPGAKGHRTRACLAHRRQIAEIGRVLLELSGELAAEREGGDATGTSAANDRGEEPATA